MTILRAILVVSLAQAGLAQFAVHGQTKSAPAFRKDGELVFLSPKGATRARIDVEIAERQEERLRGLMFRERLEESQGMLFVYPAEAPLSFWMKDTPIPLDVIFLNADRTVVTIRQNTVPFSETAVLSDRPARYVVEVNAGFSVRHRLAPGDKVFWQRL